MACRNNKNSMYALVCTVCAILFCANANAVQYNNGRFGFRLTGYGTAGTIQPDFNEPKYLGDWNVRAQMNYAVARGQTLGLVYAMNQSALSDDKFLDEAFALFESRNLGRIEIGATDSIAHKLGVGLPDVGGLRINDDVLFYKKIHPKGTVIGEPVLDTGSYLLRANIVSVPTAPVQYGLSVAGVTSDYKYAVDAGMKIRQPNGKTKTAYSLGVSFMDSPNGYTPYSFSSPITADWRTQASLGMNLQYNSFIVALDARAIYDKNPIGIRSDGFNVGTGVSYDILNYSLSVSYILSDTGVWDSDVDDYVDNTVIASFRYKYNKNVDAWFSVGYTTETPFMATGVRLTF